MEEDEYLEEIINPAQISSVTLVPLTEVVSQYMEGHWLVPEQELHDEPKTTDGIITFNDSDLPAEFCQAGTKSGKPVLYRKACVVIKMVEGSGYLKYFSDMQEARKYYSSIAQAIPNAIRCVAKPSDIEDAKEIGG